jgi:hypothetical protein
MLDSSHISVADVDYQSTLRIADVSQVSPLIETATQLAEDV